jgi:trigger factor
MKPAEKRSFSVTYRDNYPEKRLAGKTVDYTITVEGVKEKKLPELNDDFAQGYGDYKTLDDLKAKIRSDLETHKRNGANEQMREKLLEWLEDNNHFEVPSALVDRQLETRLQRLLRDLSRKGINPQRLDVDWSKVRDDQRLQSERDVKGSLILDYISNKEGIAVGEDEVDAEIEAMANEAQRPKEKVREILSKDNGLDRVMGQIRTRKTLDFLMEKAEIRPASQITQP